MSSKRTLEYTGGKPVGTTTKDTDHSFEWLSAVVASDRYAVAFCLRQHGRTLEEIGEVLGISPPRVQTLIERATADVEYATQPDWLYTLSRIDPRAKMTLDKEGFASVDEVGAAINACEFHWRSPATPGIGKKTFYIICRWLRDQGWRPDGCYRDRHPTEASLCESEALEL